MFVDDTLRSLDIAPDYVSRGYFRDALDAGVHYNLPRRPILAGEWADKTYPIPNWDVVSSPQIGDVAAYSKRYSDASGHVGIVGYDVSKGGFTLISASVVDDKITEVNLRDLGYREKVSFTYRRYAGVK